MAITEEKNEPIKIPTLADNHYFLFNKEFDATSCGDAMTFIIERNLMPEPPEAIRLIINSPGGIVSSMFSLCDVIYASRIPVYTFGLGAIISCGLMLFMAGEKGHRYITKNTEILSHQYSGYTFGKEHELWADRKGHDLVSQRIMAHYRKHTGLKDADIRKYLLPSEDVWLSPKEAIKYGLADKIIDTL